MSLRLSFEKGCDSVSLCQSTSEPEVPKHPYHWISSPQIKRLTLWTQLWRSSPSLHKHASDEARSQRDKSFVGDHGLGWENPCCSSGSTQARASITHCPVASLLDTKSKTQHTWVSALYLVCPCKQWLITCSWTWWAGHVPRGDAPWTHGSSIVSSGERLLLLVSCIVCVCLCEREVGPKTSQVAHLKMLTSAYVPLVRSCVGSLPCSSLSRRPDGTLGFWQVATISKSLAKTHCMTMAFLRWWRFVLIMTLILVANRAKEIWIRGCPSWCVAFEKIHNIGVDPWLFWIRVADPEMSDILVTELAEIAKD